jgi:hypothetical protein
MQNPLSQNCPVVQSDWQKPVAKLHSSQAVRGQSPHDPPHPSSPQTFPSQMGRHMHTPSWQTLPLAHDDVHLWPVPQISQS